jgi:hypothetical protein
MHKPTTAQIHQALDDLDEGKPISADMRVAVNQYQRLRAEAHLEQEENADAVWKQGAKGRASALREEWLILNNKCLSKGLTPQEEDRYQRLWMFALTNWR